MSQADGSVYLHPEGRAREVIDKMLTAAGWVVQNVKDVNLYAGEGVAVRELLTKAGPADYVLFVNQRPVGVVEAKKKGTPLSGVEWQTLKYQANVPGELEPFLFDGRLPFGYESTGAETWFTCRMDPQPRARRVFWFHRPETLASEIEYFKSKGTGTLRARIPQLPALGDDPDWLRSAQAEAIRRLEGSLKANHPRALIQMATGSGKTFCAVNISERLVNHADATRILFLVDRKNLGTQTLKEFQGFEVPGTSTKFSSLYNVVPLQRNSLNPSASVCIATIQRVHSMLRGEADIDPEIEELSADQAVPEEPVHIGYNPELPIEAFDVIIVDECHRSIYGVWRQVLEYFDAFLIGLTATPGKHTFGFFNGNLVMEYGFPMAVVDHVNVDFDVFRLSTAITERGSTIKQGYWTTFRDRETRAERMELADEDIAYRAHELDNRVVSEDQIRTVMRAIGDNLPLIFPDRETDERGRLVHIPKTLIFAKDDSHAEDIVRIARDVLSLGNDDIAKITYKSSDSEQQLQSFRTSYNPRIAVTVDMIATGTDVKPIEMVVFMRSVRSRSRFEQMKGRGVRTISDEDLQFVTPDAKSKDRFVLVDAVGVTETMLIESTPLERKRGVALEKVLQQVSFGQVSEDLVSTLATRLARLSGRLPEADREKLDEIAGESLSAIEHRLVAAIDPDVQLLAAQAATGRPQPSEAELAQTQKELLTEAVKPFASNPEFRRQLVDVQRNFEQVIDNMSVDAVTRAEFAVDARARAANMVTSFKEFLEENQDEITALKVFYGKPYAQKLTYRDIKELAEAIQRPPHRWTPEHLWEAYEALDASKVRGSAITVLTNIVSLVRYTLGIDDELAPFPDKVGERYEAWMLQQETAGRQFTDEQRDWLALMRDHIATSLSIEPLALMESPFSQRGGLGKAKELFGDDLEPLLTELTETLAA